MVTPRRSLVLIELAVEGTRRFIGKNVKDEDCVDFGASDAAMNDEDIEQVPNGVVLLPMTAGGVVLAYNLPTGRGSQALTQGLYRHISR